VPHQRPRRGDAAPLCLIDQKAGQGTAGLDKLTFNAQRSEHMFNAQTELEKLRQVKAVRRRKYLTQSRLHRYRAELVKLRQAGASYPELTLWLQHNKRMRVAHTTVMRYLKQLPELMEPSTTQDNDNA
jgi:hypothetical protein